MTLSASLAARITRVSLAAISRATRSAASSSSARGTTSCTEPKWCSVGRVDRRGGEEQPAHQVLRHQPRQVGGRAERAAFDLGQAERGVVGGDDDVGVADQPDAAADAEAVDGGDDRHLALVDRAECGEAAAVGVDQRGDGPSVCAASP